MLAYSLGPLPRVQVHHRLFGILYIDLCSHVPQHLPSKSVFVHSVIFNAKHSVEHIITKIILMKGGPCIRTRPFRYRISYMERRKDKARCEQGLRGDDNFEHLHGPNAQRLCRLTVANNSWPGRALGLEN